MAPSAVYPSPSSVASASARAHHASHAWRYHGTAASRSSRSRSSSTPSENAPSGSPASAARRNASSAHGELAVRLVSAADIHAFRCLHSRQDRLPPSCRKPRRSFAFVRLEKRVERLSAAPAGLVDEREEARRGGGGCVRPLEARPQLVLVRAAATEIGRGQRDQVGFGHRPNEAGAAPI